MKQKCRRRSVYCCFLMAARRKWQGSQERCRRKIWQNAPGKVEDDRNIREGKTGTVLPSLGEVTLEEAVLLYSVSITIYCQYFTKGLDYFEIWLFLFTIWPS